MLRCSWFFTSAAEKEETKIDHVLNYIPSTWRHSIESKTALSEDTRALADKDTTVLKLHKKLFWFFLYCIPKLISWLSLLLISWLSLLLIRQELLNNVTLWLQVVFISVLRSPRRNCLVNSEMKIVKKKLCLRSHRFINIFTSTFSLIRSIVSVITAYLSTWAFVVVVREVVCVIPLAFTSVPAAPCRTA